MTEQTRSFRPFTKDTSSGTDQAWSIKSQVSAKKNAKVLENSKILDFVAETLKSCPELYCKLHGITDANKGDADPKKTLSAYFKLDSKLSIQDELARQRAVACKDELVKLGVPVDRLLVTWAGRGTQSKVDFFLMEPVEASAAKAAWGAKAAARTLKRFQNELNELKQQHIHFDSVNTSATEHQSWSSIKPLNAAKKTSNATEQAWSIESLDDAKEALNSKILDLVASTLKSCPELHCKLHGSTDAKRGDLDRNKTLMARFKLKSELSIQDELARQRTMACKDGLVARGVLDNQLLVTWAGGGKLSKVNLFVMRADEASDAKAAWEEEEVTAP